MRQTSGLGSLTLVLSFFLCATSVGGNGVALLSSITTLFGTLEVVHGAPPTDSSAVFREYFLVQNTLLGERVTQILKIEDFVSVHLLRSGVKLSVKGSLTSLVNVLGVAQILTAVNVSLVAEVHTESRSKRSASATVATTTRSRKPIITYVSLSDAATPGLTPAQFETYYNSDANSYRKAVLKMTNGTFSFEQVVDAGAVNISGTVASCDYRTWKDQVVQTLKARGHNMTRFDHLIMVFPSNVDTACGWCGLAIVGCLDWGATYCWSILGCNYPHVIGHEVGHNLGMHHSGSPTAEYGDNTCVMGSAPGNAYLNLPQRVRWGYMRDQNGYGVTAGSGAYTLTDAYNPSTDNLQGLRVPFGSDLWDAFWVSWRLTNSDDPALGSTYHNRLYVHYMAPGSIRPIVLARLAVGESYQNVSRSITIAFTASNPTTRIATTSITLGPCNRAAPSVSVSITNNCPPTYSISIKNNDQGSCDPRSYAPASPVATNMSSGWSASFSGSTNSIASGATVVGTLTFQRPALSFSYTGSFTAAWRLLSGNAAIYAGINGTQFVDFKTPKLTAPTLSAAVVSRAPQLTWTSVKYSSSGCTSSAVSASFEIFRNNAKIATTNATTFSDVSTGLRGSVDYRVDAVYEGVRSSSNVVSASVAANSGTAQSGGATIQLANPAQATVSSTVGENQRKIVISANQGQDSALVISSTEKQRDIPIAEYSLLLSSIIQYNESSPDLATDVYSFSNIGWLDLALKETNGGDVTELVASTSDERVTVMFAVSKREVVHEVFGYLEAGVLNVRFSIAEFWYNADLVATNRSRLALVATLKSNTGDVRFAGTKALLGKDAVTIAWSTTATADGDVEPLRAEVRASGADNQIFYSISASGKANVAWNYNLELEQPAAVSLASRLLPSICCLGILLVTMLLMN